MTRPLAFPIVLSLVLASVAMADDSKLDADLEDADRLYPVFVRMTDQLIGKAGDYEKFCANNGKKKRSELRSFVLKTLRDKSETSWKKIAADVEKLSRDGQVKNVERYWIVNGFACESTGKACQQLAASQHVSFVYLQRGPLRQFARDPKKQPQAEQQKVYEQVLKEWQDDSNEAFSTDGLEIPWNLKRIQADAVWKEEKITGKGVVVALSDSGIMATPSLVRALWKNPKEKLDGKDSDDNGYVDDLFGYDFAAQSFYALGDSATLPHGSMCAGIIAGRPLNSKKLVTGIAPRARLMMLRGMGFLKAYEYALANGADVLSMSYMWVNIDLGNYRGVYRTAHEHLAAGGVVSVGGAGNFSRLGKGRQIALPKDIPCVIAAAGIVEDGSKAPASSEGPCYWDGVRFYDDYPQAKPLQKPDVTGIFGGYPVWGRPQIPNKVWKIFSNEGDQFALVIGPQGNSFSGPHAAGVAALMLSANSDLNAWEIKSLMEETCKDIGDKGRDTTFGAGLLQALDAVRAAKKAKK